MSVALPEQGQLVEVRQRRYVVTEVRQAARPSLTPVWPAIASQQLPADGWLDLWHLNARGAAALSRWLAERVSVAVDAGELTRPHERQSSSPS